MKSFLTILIKRDLLPQQHFVFSTDEVFRTYFIIIAFPTELHVLLF